MVLILQLFQEIFWVPGAARGRFYPTIAFSVQVLALLYALPLHFIRNEMLPVIPKLPFYPLQVIDHLLYAGVFITDVLLHEDEVANEEPEDKENDRTDKSHAVITDRCPSESTTRPEIITCAWSRQQACKHVMSGSRCRNGMSMIQLYPIVVFRQISSAAFY